MNIIPFQYLPEVLSLDDLALSKIGINIYDSKGNIKNTITILEELAKLWDEGIKEILMDEINLSM